MDRCHETEARLRLTTDLLQPVEAHVCVAYLGVDHHRSAARVVDAQKITGFRPTVIANHDIKPIEEVG